MPASRTKCDLLQIHPIELRFPLELKKRVSCSVKLTNNSNHCVAFKVMTTNTKNYGVRPVMGVIFAHSTCDFTVTMRAQNEYPRDMKCKDKFAIWSAVVKPGFPAKDITSEMFKKESSENQLVDECKLRVSYVPPCRSPKHGILEAVLKCTRRYICTHTERRKTTTYAGRVYVRLDPADDQ